MRSPHLLMHCCLRSTVGGSWPRSLGLNGPRLAPAGPSRPQQALDLGRAHLAPPGPAQSQQAPDLSRAISAPAGLAWPQQTLDLSRPLLAPAGFARPSRPRTSAEQPARVAPILTDLLVWPL